MAGQDSGVVGGKLARTENIKSLPREKQQVSKKKRAAKKPKLRWTNLSEINAIAGFADLRVAAGEKGGLAGLETWAGE